MISKEKSFEIARSVIPQKYRIKSVIETKTMFIFCDERVDSSPIGYRPVAVRKKDGSCFGVFYPDYAQEIKNGIKTKIPAK